MFEAVVSFVKNNQKPIIKGVVSAAGALIGLVLANVVVSNRPTVVVVEEENSNEMPDLQAGE